LDASAISPPPPPAQPSAPQKAQTERELYARIYSNAQDSVFLLDSDSGKIIFANPRTTEDTSYELEELLQDFSFRNLFLPEDQPAIDTLLQSTVQWNAGTDPQRFLKRKSGKKIIVEITSLLVEFEGKKAICCTVRDITGRVKAEQKILEYSKELEKINAELEDRVKQRTQELASALDQVKANSALIMKQKKELDDVMNNIGQGIFTLGPQLTVNPDYSRFTASIFGDKTVAGADIATFLFNGPEVTERGPDLREWLTAIFEDPNNWDLLKDFSIREHHYIRADKESGRADARDLAIEWRPIYEPINEVPTLTKLMLVCSDITEQKRLQAEIARKESEHNEELELISHLIHLPFEVVEQFITDFKRNLKAGRDALDQGQDSLLTVETLTIIRRSLHTLKGSARQFNLNSIQRRAHELETKLEGVEEKALSGQDREDFYKAVDQEFQALEKGLRNIMTIYEKMVHGRGSDKGGSGHAHDSNEIIIPVSLSRIDLLLEKAFSSPLPVPSKLVRRTLSWLISVPVAQLFDRLEMLAKSLSQQLNIPVSVIREGEELRIDPRAAALLYDALLHVIRNSMDHGAETLLERQTAGKSEAFTLTFSAKPAEKEKVLITVSDDGKGINREAVKKKVLEKGLLAADAVERCTPEQVLEFVFLPGFSTKDSVSELSGRGVGMDVLKDTVENVLHGKVSISSEQGKGTRIMSEISNEAFSHEPPTAAFVTTQPDPAVLIRELESTLKVELKQVAAPSVTTESRAILCDITGLAALEQASKVADISDRLICLDRLEPSAVVTRPLGNPHLRHFVHLDSPKAHLYLKTTIDKCVQSFAWGLEPYLKAGTPFRSFVIRDYGEKNKVIEQLTEFQSTVRAFSGLGDILGTVADEMIMNAMFDAPRTADGKAKYNHLSRADNLVLEPHEAVKFRFGADRDWIGLSIEDPFGALTQDIFLKHVTKGYRQGTDQISKKEGGAGLGLFMTFDNSHCVVINVAPGKKTEVICLIGLGKSYSAYQSAGKSFSYFLPRR